MVYSVLGLLIYLYICIHNDPKTVFRCIWCFIYVLFVFGLVLSIVLEGAMQSRYGHSSAKKTFNNPVGLQYHRGQ